MHIPLFLFHVLLQNNQIAPGFHIDLLGDSLFSCFRKPFYLDEHIDRFLNSAQLLKLKVSHTKEQIRDIVLEGIRRNTHMNEFYIKMVALPAPKE